MSRRRTRSILYLIHLLITTTLYFKLIHSASSSRCHDDYCSNQGRCLQVSQFLFTRSSYRCEPPWAEFENTCFRIFWKTTSWEEASSVCSQNKAFLYPDPYKSFHSLFLDILKITYAEPVKEKLNFWTKHCNRSGNCSAITQQSDFSSSDIFNVSITDRVIPVCFFNITNAVEAPAKQCQCCDNVGIRCDEEQSTFNQEDFILSGRNISCPKRPIRIDYAAFRPQEEKICPIPQTRDVAESTDIYSPNALFLLKYWCQGKQYCRLDNIVFDDVLYLRTRDESETPTRNEMRVRYYCDTEDNLKCVHGDYREVENKTGAVTCLKPICGDFNWWSALEMCRSMGGNLAFFPNDSNAVQSILQKINTVEFLHASQVWIWLKSAKGTYQHPEDEEHYHPCTYLTVDMENETLNAVHGKADLPCYINTQHHWLCKFHPEPGKDSCPHNATVFTMDTNTVTCYLLGQEKLIYGEARAKCENMNGSLASFYEDKHATNVHFYNFLKTSLIAALQDFWIGGIADAYRPINGVFQPCSRIKKDRSSINSQSGPIIESCSFNELRNAICAYPPSGNPLIYVISTTTLSTTEPTTTPTTSNFQTEVTIPFTSEIPLTTKYARMKNCSQKIFHDHLRGYNMTWPETRGDILQELPCPGRSKGISTWFCDAEMGFFSPPNRPNLSNCRIIHEDFDNHTPAQSVADKLLGSLEDSIYGGDLETVVQVLSHLNEKRKNENEKLHPKDRLDATINYTETLMEIFDNLLHENQSSAWLDFPEETRVNISTQLLGLVDSVGFSLAAMLHNESISFKKKNLEFLASNYPKEKYKEEEMKFPLNKESDTTVIILPKSTVSKAADKNGSVHSVFVKYYNLSLILPTSSYEKAKLNSSGIQHNSDVLGASVGKGLRFESGENVKAIFKHQNSNSNIWEINCVFWNMTGKGFWDDDGCTVNKTNATHTICLCNHLTNFAVLMDIQGIFDNGTESHVRALTWITVVGCTISIICLVVSCLIFISFRSLWNLRNAIHCNLCLSLLVSQIVLLIGLDRTESKVGCGFVAGLLHFSWLSAFVWMAAEGVMIYILLIKVFETGEQRAWHYYIVGYGIPAVIVIVSASCKWEGYGTPQYCWLSTEDGLIFAFVGPLAAIIIFNIVILSLALRAAASVKLQRHQSKVEVARLWIKRAVSLVPLLGLSWIFGFLYIDNNSIIFAYLFAIFNSIQGIFIFIFHCLRNEKVQQVVTRYIAKKRERLDSLAFSGKSSRSNSCTVTTSIRTGSGSASSETPPSSGKKPPRYGIFPKTRVAPARWRYKLDITINSICVEPNGDCDRVEPNSNFKRDPFAITEPEDNKVPNGVFFRVRSASDVSV